VRSYRASTRPADPDLCGLAGRGQHRHGTILRPVAGPTVDFAQRPEMLPELETHCGADAESVPRWTFQPDAQPRLAEPVVKAFGFLVVLSHDEVHPAVAVKVANRRTALFAVHFHPTLLAGHCTEISMTIALQPQASPSIVTGGFGF